MKRLIPILLAVFAFAACEKDLTWTNWTMTIWFTPTTTRKLTSNNSARTTSLTAFSSSEIKRSGILER